jgi:hypothetical protein
MEYTIVLVMLFNMQPYIMDNLDHLLQFNNRRIIVLTDAALMHHFARYSAQGVQVVAVEGFYPNYQQKIQNKVQGIRQGFWFLTTFRFEILRVFMQLRQLTNVIHLENDVMLYVDADNELRFHRDDRVLLTLDSQHRAIPGFMYMPNAAVLGKCLSFFQKGLNDMQNWAHLFHVPEARAQCVDTLPIGPTDVTTPARKMVTMHFPKYNAVFDAAAIGQYLGGIDPRNTTQKSTVGFINETCVLKYNEYTITYDQNRPYLVAPGHTQPIPIICLHIHSKNLKAFRTLPPAL